MRACRGRRAGARSARAHRGRALSDALLRAETRDSGADSVKHRAILRGDVVLGVRKVCAADCKDGD